MLRDFLEANCETRGDIEANTNNFVGIFRVLTIFNIIICYYQFS